MSMYLWGVKPALFLYSHLKRAEPQQKRNANDLQTLRHFPNTPFCQRRYAVFFLLLQWLVIFDMKMKPLSFKQKKHIVSLSPAIVKWHKP